MGTAHKVVIETEFVSLVKGWQKNGQVVVFSNGCFDLLHPGHVEYLEKARQMGDRLVVAVNTDPSVRRLKGDKRPVTNQSSRARLIAALECIDLVTLFDQDTPLELITKVLPDVLVKGADYDRGEIVGALEVEQHGGRVETIELVEGFSTSELIRNLEGKS